jgi:dolichol-phosphate mannosyltransferase
MRHSKLGRLAQPLKFGLVGFSGMAVQLLTLTLLVQTLPRDMALALAIWVAMTSNFVLNRTLTFAGARSGPIGRQYVLFLASCLVGAVVNWAVTMALASASSFFAEHFRLAAAVGIGIGAVSNYVLCATAAFRVQRPMPVAVEAELPSLAQPLPQRSLC